jgi:hypothetical protein
MVLALLVANWILKRIYPRATPRLRLVRGTFFGCISGILSAHSLLIAKSAVELLVRTIIDRHNEFNRWQSWMILLGLVAFALTQLYYMHRGLKLCSTSVLYPLIFCVYNIIAIIDGLIYFHQSSRLSGLQAGLIALGTLILLGGVVSLSWRLDEEDDEPTSPITHKHRRVPPPQNVLTPGMALVATMDEDSDSSVDIDDVEPGVHGAITDQLHRRAADERTPLLARAPTGPAVTVTRRSKKRPHINTSDNLAARASPSPRRPHHRRRITISEETNEIWNELNDRENLLSPAPRSGDLNRRPRSGTLPARRYPSSASWLDQTRRTSWWDRTFSGSRRGSARSRDTKNTSRGSHGHSAEENASYFPQNPQPEDNQSDTEAELHTQSNRRRNSWFGGKNNANGGQDTAGDWLKLKWWRKRWKDHDREDEENGGDGRT